MSTLTTGDLASIGGAFLASVVACNRVGHTSPAGTLDYMGGSDEGAPAVVRDYIDWVSGRDLYPGAADRLRELVELTGYTDLIVDRVAAERESGT